MKPMWARMIYTMRNSRDMKQQDLADALGVSRSLVGAWERGEREPGLDAIDALADIFNVPPSAILGNRNSIVSNVRPLSDQNMARIPLIGSVAAGVPILADEQYDTYIDGPSKADYALRIDGDSMEPTYLNGDVVYIRKTDDVDDGKVAVVLVDDSATLKHCYHIKDGLNLISENPKYAPMIIKYGEYDTIRILGEVCGFTRMYR